MAISQIAQVIGQLAGQGGIAIGAGLAIAGGAIATGMVQSGVGSSAVGVLAEKPEENSKLLLYYLIPETLVVFGFVIAFLLLGKMGGGAH